MSFDSGASRVRGAAAVVSRHLRRALDRAGADHSSANAPIIIAVDERSSIDRVLAGTLAALRLTPTWIGDVTAVPALRRYDDSGFALVAVRDDANPGSAVLAAVTLLKRNGYTVLCYWHGKQAWTLGAQCRLLVAGASHLLDRTSPAFGAELRERLAQLLQSDVERRHEDRALREQMQALGVVGSGPGITAVFRHVQRVSVLSDVPVLVVGETGTGKELAARAIHALDPRRRSGPFVAVNCGAIGAGIAESELFGHRRGAFTGAANDRKGLVRAAHGGVLFLDEIGDLDANLQAKLLRVLQERRVLPLGEDQEVPVDVRIIAATHRDLENMVATQAFRADLFHRLNVVSIQMPALRERPEDIPALVEHMIASDAARGEGSALVASDEFINALRRTGLPGNVRQLGNVVRRAVLASPGGRSLRLSDLPSELLTELAGAAGATGAVVGAVVEELPADMPRHDEGGFADTRAEMVDVVAVLEATSWKLEGAVDLCEQKIVAAALTLSSGNRSRAARMLGISARSMFNKMRKYRLTA
jgi:sigma-54 dependent transcriptional regulator, flagellar regulatory protein